MLNKLQIHRISTPATQPIVEPGKSNRFVRTSVERVRQARPDDRLPSLDLYGRTPDRQELVLTVGSNGVPIHVEQ